MYKTPTEAVATTDPVLVTKEPVVAVVVVSMLPVVDPSF